MEGGWEDFRTPGAVWGRPSSTLALCVGGGAGSRAPADPLSAALSSDWSIVSWLCPSQPLSDGLVVQDGPAAGPGLRPCIMHQQLRQSFCVWKPSRVGAWAPAEFCLPGTGRPEGGMVAGAANRGGGIRSEVNERGELWCHGSQYGPSWLEREGWPTSSSRQPGKESRRLPGLPGLL